MLGRRFVPTLVNYSKIMKPAFPSFIRGFSDEAEKTEEKGDPEVLSFIKKVCCSNFHLFQDCYRE